MPQVRQATMASCEIKVHHNRELPMRLRDRVRVQQEVVLGIRMFG